MKPRVFSKNIDNVELSKYLLLTGIGMFLYFVSDKATVNYMLIHLMA